MLEVSEAEAGALADQSKLASSEGLTRIMEVLADAEMRLRDAASKKILLEVALLKAIEARSAVSLDSVLKQLQDLRDGKASDVVTIPVPAAAPTPGPKPFRAEASAADPVMARSESVWQTTEIREPLLSPGSPLSIGLEDGSEVRAVAGDLEQLWTSLVEAVGRASPFARTYLLEAHPVSFERNLFIIGFDPEFEDHISLVDNARNHTLLQTKLLELGHPGAQIKFIKAEAPANRQVAVTPPPLPQPDSTTAGTPAAATPQGT